MEALGYCFLVMMMKGENPWYDESLGLNDKEIKEVVQQNK